MEQYSTVDPSMDEGLLCTFGNWANSRTEAMMNMIPCAYAHTPLAELPKDRMTIQYIPPSCKTCGAQISPLCQVEFEPQKIWECCICKHRNAFAQQYNVMSRENLPQELFPNSTTIEFNDPSRQVAKPVFMFVVDTAITEQEMDGLKDSLQQAVTLLPEDAYVGLITFGTMVQVHQLGFTECARSFALKGCDLFTAESVCTQLDLPLVNEMTRQATAAHRATTQIKPNSFVQPLSDCCDMLEMVLDDMVHDEFGVSPKDNSRPLRCTGAALKIAQCVLESVARDCGGRIMMFLGGACTHGQGQVVDAKVTEMIRTHTDLERGRAPFYHEAKEFYDEVATRCLENGHAIDIFACSLDQVGLLEMRSCLEKTGGVVVMGDTFSQSMYTESLKRVFNRYERPAMDYGTQSIEHPDDDHLMMGFRATTTIHCSSGIRLNGCLGPCTSTKTILESTSVSDNQIGEGETQTWLLGAINPSSTFVYYCEPSNEDVNNIDAPKDHFIQFKTTYQHPSGFIRTRITTRRTLMFPMNEKEPNSFAAVGESFNAEVASLVLGRMAMVKVQDDSPDEAIKFIDRCLIRVCVRFGSVHGEQLRLPGAMAVFPQMMFNLRRSQFIRTFNCSPDESLYFRHALNYLPVGDAAICIQPSLFSYQVGKHGDPVDLDASSVQPDVILLLDTFFRVVVFHGSQVAQWREAGYHKDPKYGEFADLLEIPFQDAQELMEARFPVPRYVVCDHGKSQARFLMNKLNPSITHKTQESGGGVSGNGVMMSEDVNFNVFFNKLVAMVLQSKTA
eukprot:TRINITY_DN14993_c0_g1_i1.p1 TRINITY_DN14993_c0_g1~~TRINITY_DN14993_c0_g1_i1.p1  ORF type:complete len:795 (+),score=220.80 TRINITY_DN14993_c0_g1_i1:24-2387(+)